MSSLLKVPAGTGDIGYGAEPVANETINVKTLDTGWPTLHCAGQRTLLKIDTHGFDLAVLRGAAASLPHIQAIQLEVPLRSIYDDQPAIGQMLPVLRGLGFHLVELAKVCRAEGAGELLEMDGLFLRAGQEPTPAAK